MKFYFDHKCQHAFDKLKVLLTTAPIIRPPDWSLPFELMCDALNQALGAILGQRVDEKLRVIYYASQTLNEAQLNYSTTEKEFLSIVFASEKFRSFFIGTNVIIFSDYKALNCWL